MSGTRDKEEAVIDVKTGAMINPHNPEFITRRPWYLGDDSGPSLDHQNAQKPDDKQTLTLSAADEAISKQRALQKSIQSVFDCNVGAWIECKKNNVLPYKMAQLIRISRKKKEVDVRYEDGTVEKKISVVDNSKKKQKKMFKGSGDRIRLIRNGARASLASSSVVGQSSEQLKDTYDSKRDAYHGFDVNNFNQKMNDKFEAREQMRRKQREQQSNDVLDEEGTKKLDSKEERNSDSDDSDYDDSDLDSEDEFVQKDGDDKMFTSRLARQGGVGGAQMKVTARNLRIREDTAKYLRNLDPNSAYYDPKSRSMRDNPNPEVAPEELAFAGDNFARVSGDAVQLADTQVFAWDASDQGAQIHPQATPSMAETLNKQFKKKSTDLKTEKKKAILNKYGGTEYLDTSSAADKTVRFGTTVKEIEYQRDGRPVGSTGAKVEATLTSKYEEDILMNGHKTIWGSYFHKGAFSWGFEDDHSLMRNAYYTGPNGKAANDEANELKYGNGESGSIALAQAREMLKAAPKSDRSTLSSAPPSASSALYGEANQNQSVDQTKLKKAMLKQSEKEDQLSDERKRKYNSMNATGNDLTVEDMEVYRLKKNRCDDPMNKIDSDKLLDYKK